MPFSFFQTNQAALLRVAAKATGSTGFAADAVAFAIAREKSAPVDAVVVFERFTGGTAEMHLAMTRPGARMSREMLDAMTGLAFHRMALSLSAVNIQIADDNRHALSTAIKQGFQFEYRKRGGFAGGKDAIVLSLPAARVSEHIEDGTE